MISEKILRQLQNLDLDFSSNIPGLTKSIHWYPGTFPSELPMTLIQALSNQEQLILDPYGGIGTTALEALRLGRKAWLVEYNPVGALIGYVGSCLIVLKALDETLPSQLISVINQNIHFLKSKNSKFDIDIDIDFLNKIDSKLENLVEPIPAIFLKNYTYEPNWVILEKWIERETLLNIKEVFGLIHETNGGAFLKLLILVMLSAVLRTTSSQTQSWGHIADNVWPKEFTKKDVYGLCIRWLSRTEKIIKNTQVTTLNSDSKRFWMSIHDWNSENDPTIKPDIDVNVLITSPPYANAIDYILSQKLSLYLLGFNELTVKALSNNEIGARNKRTKTTAHTTWAEQLKSALNKQLSFVSHKVSMAFVLPHKDAGREIGPQYIEDLLKAKNFNKVIEIDRSIRQVRTRQSWTSIKKEIVQIYSSQD